MAGLGNCAARQIGDDVGVQTCQTTQGKVMVPPTAPKLRRSMGTSTSPLPEAGRRHEAFSYPASHQRLRKGRRGEASRPAQHLLPIQIRAYPSRRLYNFVGRMDYGIRWKEGECLLGGATGHIIKRSDEVQLPPHDRRNHALRHFSPLHLHLLDHLNPPPPPPAPSPTSPTRPHLVSLPDAHIQSALCGLPLSVAPSPRPAYRPLKRPR